MQAIETFVCFLIRDFFGDLFPRKDTGLANQLHIFTLIDYAKYNMVKYDMQAKNHLLASALLFYYRIENVIPLAQIFS